MERIEPTTLQGPRAYFTNIDHRIVSRSQDKQLLRREVERRLKILLLTKGIVVCAASHLTSSFAYSLFRDNPILLREGLVIPALRRDRRDIADVFEGKDVPAISDDERKEMIGFYNSNLTKVVSWDLFDNSSWFRNQFLHQLKDNNSVLRRSLKKVSRKRITQMMKEVETNPILERETIEWLSQELKDSDRISLMNFRELLYHISGSRVVHCEGNLPQEDYIDYDLRDISEGNTSLSDVSVFWKIFLEVAFDTLRKPNFPVDLLDLLAFENIHQIRKPLLDGNFQEKYDQIVKKSIQAITADNPGKIMLDVNEIMMIRDKLALTFDEIFEKELADFSKKKMKALQGQRTLVKSGSSFALGILGLVPHPVVSIIAGTASILMETPSFLINLFGTIKTRKGMNQYQAYLERREAVLRKIIDKSKISEKTPLLDAVDVLASYLSEKVRV